MILKDLEGASESEIREGLKQYAGVRGVTVENGEASVIFERHWQTSRPIKEGVTVNGRVRKSGNSSWYWYWYWYWYLWCIKNESLVD